MEEFLDAVESATKDYEAEYQPKFQSEVKKSKEEMLARVLADVHLSK